MRGYFECSIYIRYRLESSRDIKCVFEEDNKSVLDRMILTVRKGQIITVEGIFIDEESYYKGLYHCKIVSLSK